MSTQNTHTTYTIGQINHRVRSGGIYWKQCLIVADSAWYLVSEAKLGDALHPKWLISNTNLAKLLRVSANNLASYYQAVMSVPSHAIYHDDAPVHFVLDDGKPIRRTRQLMWTLSGVKFIINLSGIRIDAAIKSSIRAWILAQSSVYGVELSPSFATRADPVTVTKVKDLSITCVADAVQNITASVRYVAGIVDQLCLEVNRRKELEEEMATLRKQVMALTGNLPGLPSKLPNKIDAARKADKPAVQFTQAPKADRGKAMVFAIGNNGSENESLHQYIARRGNKHHRAENLTRIGLLNSDQLYSLFADSWIDPATNKLIKKDKFQELLRRTFHVAHSSHRTPILKSEMIRANMAVVCQVLCKKKPNPTDDNGNQLELDNPAYVSSAEPCVRFQTRYTAKAIDYLKDKWHMILGQSSGQKIKS
jgi:hypothetical protein